MHKRRIMHDHRNDFGILNVVSLCFFFFFNTLKLFTEPNALRYVITPQFRFQMCVRNHISLFVFSTFPKASLYSPAPPAGIP